MKRGARRDDGMGDIHVVTIGFLGCGNIGSGVWRLINEMAPAIEHREKVRLRVKRMLVRNMNKARPNVPHELLTTNPDDVLGDPEISIVAEFMGGAEPANTYMQRALAAGKTVVTANKMALALNWSKLQATATASGAGLFYEASVCGGIPIIRTITTSLQANRFSRVVGIINGTTNYILSEMTAKGLDYAEALAQAQRLGLAEPDPSADVNGLDAAYKLSILSTLAFHARIPFDRIYCEGITGVAAEDIEFGRSAGYTVKLLAIAKRAGQTVEARVHPAFIPSDHPLASVSGSYNAVFLTGNAVDDLMLYGRGAGDMPTASAIVSDLINASKAQHFEQPTFLNRPIPPDDLTIDANFRSKFYVRMSVADRVGVLEALAGAFARQNVSIASMGQTKHGPGRVPLTVTTHETCESAMRAALASISEETAIVRSVIRIEELGESR